MRRACFITVAACAAFASLPSVAFGAISANLEDTAATTDQSNQTGVSHTDRLAIGYTPSDGELIIDSLLIKGSSEATEYCFEIPSGYSGHNVTFYIEHSDGNREKLRRRVPVSNESATISIDVATNGETIITAVLDLWNKQIDQDCGGPLPNYDIDIVQQAYKDFAKHLTTEAANLDTKNLSIALVAKNPSSVKQIEENSLMLEEIPLTDKGTSSYYAENYRPPEQGGKYLGTFKYAFNEIETSTAGSYLVPVAGFSFKVDPSYAGQLAKVYIDSGYPVEAPGGGGLGLGHATHTVEIGEDGSFVIPYGCFEPCYGDDSEHPLAYFSTLDNTDYNPPVNDGEGFNRQGRVSLNIIPRITTPSGAWIVTNDVPMSAETDEGMTVTLEDSDLNLSLLNFRNARATVEEGYIDPQPGGEFFGGFSVQASPAGNDGQTGYLKLRMNVGEEYAGRTVTVFTSYSNNWMSGFSDIQTYTVNDTGSFYVSNKMTVSHMRTVSCDEFGATYYINLEPAKTLSITDAVVSAIPSQIWKGGVIAPKPSVAMDGELLTEGIDYSLSYIGNDKPGTATVVITGKGGYSGTISVEFQIVEDSEPSTGDTDTPDKPAGDQDEDDIPDSPAPSFPDVSQADWYHDAIIKAAKLGVMNGYSDTGKFGPLDQLTREQAATVLYNYLGNGDTAAPAAPQPDILNSWYTDAVNWAVANEVMNGYSGTNLFGIGDPLSREQFCAVIANAVDANTEEADLSVLAKFPDANSISSWARPSVAWAVENGVISGVDLGNGTRLLQPTRNLIRAEMATMTVNAIDCGLLIKS